MKTSILTYFDVELFCKYWNITKNGNGVFFCKDKVMCFDWLQADRTEAYTVSDLQFSDTRSCRRH